MANGIYALISEDRLKNVLAPLQEFTRMPIRLINPLGEVLLQFGSGTDFCELLKKCVFVNNECSVLHRKAGQRAQAIGEAYIFECHAGLNYIAFPLINQSELLGTVLAGPFLMEKPDTSLVSALLENHSLSAAQSIELIDQLSGIRILPPNRVNVLKKIMDQLLAPLLPSERIMMLRTQENMDQQAKINETIQLYKKQQPSSDRTFYYETEADLITKVRIGDIEGAKTVLNELIAFEMYANGGITPTVQGHFIELTTLLTRAAIDSGVSANQIYPLSSSLIARISAVEKLYDLPPLIKDILDTVSGLIIASRDGGNQYIRKALAYISEHYGQPLTITDLAEFVGLSPNHFSSLFQKSVGMKFHEYLCRVRVEESKNLLLFSDYSLTDIAIAAGFPDQSYFCKVFKRIVGLPPGQFRNK